MKIEGDEKLILADASLYRSIAMSLTSRKTGLTLLKPSIVSHMKEPRCEHMPRLKRLGRYFIKNQRCVLTCAQQPADHVRDGRAAIFFSELVQIVVGELRSACLHVSEPGNSTTTHDRRMLGNTVFLKCGVDNIAPPSLETICQR